MDVEVPIEDIRKKIREENSEARSKYLFCVKSLTRRLITKGKAEYFRYHKRSLQGQERTNLKRYLGTRIPPSNWVLRHLQNRSSIITHLAGLRGGSVLKSRWVSVRAKR